MKDPNIFDPDSSYRKSKSGTNISLQFCNDSMKANIDRHTAVCLHNDNSFIQTENTKHIVLDSLI